MHLPTRRGALALAAAMTLTLAVTPALAAGPVTIQLNGNTLNLNPAPTERAGRVFVPLRGVFENLGATVVYANRTINAQGNGHSVQLTIGSQQALVDGHSVSVDVAPFIIGASTYVPLRFVSQALGAAVNWNNATRVVSISTNGAGPAAQTVTPVPSSPTNRLRLYNELPRNGASIRGNRPQVSAEFRNATADPNTVHVFFDGRDVTADAYISGTGFSYAAPSEITPGSHMVRVTGRDTSGASFSRSWSFTSGGGTNGVSNKISNVSPSPGATVPRAFTITGTTDPGSAVTVQVSVAAQGATNLGGVLGAILGVGGNNQNVTSTATADANGRFSVPVNVAASSGSVLAVVISSTEPDYGVAAQPVHFNYTVQ